MRYSGSHQYIAREARPVILVLIVISLLFYQMIGPIWALIPLFLLLIVVILYRDPGRFIPPIPLALLSPVDGSVVFVKQGYDPYVDRQAINIRLKISSMGSFGLRSPIEGKLVAQWLFRSQLGEQALHVEKVAAKSKGIHYVVQITTDEQDDVVVVLEMPYWWQSFQCYVSVGERIAQGGRCGRTRFGGYVDFFIPETAGLEIGHNDKVVAGVSVLARLRH